MRGRRQPLALGHRQHHHDQRHGLVRQREVERRLIDERQDAERRL